MQTNTSEMDRKERNALMDGVKTGIRSRRTRVTPAARAIKQAVRMRRRSHSRQFTRGQTWHIIQRNENDILFVLLAS